MCFLMPFPESRLIYTYMEMVDDLQTCNKIISSSGQIPY